MRSQRVESSVNKTLLFLMVAIFILFTCAVVFVFSTKDNKSFSQKDTSKALAVKTVDNSPPSPNIYEKDTDGDGLADWEEVLWSTDPNNVDTDNNGIHDREEVYGKKDTQQLAYTEEATNDEKKPITATETVAREILSSYMHTLYTGDDFSETDVESLTERANNVAKPLLRAPEYTFDQTLIVPATQENKTAFIKSLYTIISGMASGVTSEHEAVYAIGNGDTDWALEELTKTVEHYKKYVTELDRVHVPVDAVTLFSTMMRALHFYIYTLEGFSLLNEDPFRSAASAKVFLEAEAQLKNSYVGMRTYIDTYFKI